MSMSKPVRIIIGLIVIALIVAAAAFAYIYFSGGSGEASEAITAPTLAPQSEATVEATAAAGSDTTSAETSSANEVLFAIVPEESEVRFGLNELLRGQPTRVIGRTDQIAGQIRVDFTNPAQSQVGIIRINVRTMVTDQEMRNRAIRSQILQSAQDEFEFSQFEPTSIDGMPDSITIGEPFTFSMTGNLTVRDITNPVTFSVTVTPVSETEITGNATAQVMRGDYNLVIPNVPSVADVSEEVDLEIDFTARAVE
jgi:polyisoprenoid-binding protein YceI